MPNPIDLTGREFGRLIALRRVSGSRTQKSRWTCRCRCGETRDIATQSLLRGRSTSCGCHRKEVSLAQAKMLHRAGLHRKPRRPEAIASMLAGRRRAEINRLATHTGQRQYIDGQPVASHSGL